MNFDCVLIAGPTASGKSRAALALAQALGGTVINADSMQVYREPRVLTARPSQADMARAPHALYGHVPAREPYSVGRYVVDAGEALGAARGTLPIFVGGTGLYFTALTEGLTDIPAIAPAIRAAARARLSEIGVEALHAELGSRDPETAAMLRSSDPQRVLRAYEVFEATGRGLAAWRGEAATPVLEGLRLAKFVLDVPRTELRSRIRARFDAMLEEGAMEEALALAGLDPSLPAAKIIGLRPLLDLDAGRIGREEAIASAVTATAQYAKRQMTWFRGRMADWRWLDGGQSNYISRLSDFVTE